MIKGIVNEIIWRIRNRWIFLRQKKFITEKVIPTVNSLQRMSDEELLRRSQELRYRSVGSEQYSNSAEACALVCEALRRSKCKLPSDTQLIGSMLINEGRIVETDSGEDVSMLFLTAIYMAVISGMHVHAVFEKDPLSEIVDFARFVFKLLGVTVGCVTSDLDPYLDKEYLMGEYACEVVYGSYSMFGLDYLKNNLKKSITDQLPISQDFAIIDQANSILLDNVRRELVVVEPDHHSTIAKIMVRNYFKLYKKLAGVASLNKMDLRERFSKVYGLTVVPIPASHSVGSRKPNNRIDYDNYIYKDKKAKYQGILEETYRITESGRSLVIVTNDVMDAYDLRDLLDSYGIRNNVIEYLHEKSCTTDMLSTIGEQYQSADGRRIGNVTIFNKPLQYDFVICLGTGVICPKCRVPPLEKLKQLNLEVEDMYPPDTVKCCINCTRYDEITKCTYCFKSKLYLEFPQFGRVECSKNVPCGLHIIGVERNSYRRLDDDILNRFIRLGDPGSSRFFLSFDGEFLKVFAPEWTTKVLSTIGWAEGEPIWGRRINKSIRKSQAKFERRDFERHKNSFCYDDILYNQMFIFYSERQKILQAGHMETLEVYDMAWKNHLSRTDALVSCIVQGNFTASLDPKVVYAENMQRMFQEMNAELPEFQAKG